MSEIHRANRVRPRANDMACMLRDGVEPVEDEDVAKMMEDELEEIVAEDPKEESQESGEEEGRQVEMLPAPHTPSKQEIQEHEISHWPYRDWCPDCVRGRGRVLPHSKTQIHA